MTPSCTPSAHSFGRSAAGRCARRRRQRRLVHAVNLHPARDPGALAEPEAVPELLEVGQPGLARQAGRAGRALARAGSCRRVGRDGRAPSWRGGRRGPGWWGPVRPGQEACRAPSLPSNSDFFCSASAALSACASASVGRVGPRVAVGPSQCTCGRDHSDVRRVARGVRGRACACTRRKTCACACHVAKVRTCAPD